MDTKQKAVFLRHAVKAPAIVVRVGIEAAHFFHPLAAPGCGVEKGHYAERLAGRLVKACQHSGRIGHFGLRRIICVKPVIHTLHERLFQIVAYNPVYEISALVMQRSCLGRIAYAQTAYFLAA